MKHTTKTLYSTRIAQVNDQFRRRAGLLPDAQAIPGLSVCTRRLAALPPALQTRLWEQVRIFQAFAVATNDPYGEHDFGACDLEDIGRMYWKIDYYADDSMTCSAHDPADPTQSYRLLTVMLAEEY